jgi:hypothetical protein
MVPQSKARNVFALSNTGIVHSNPTLVMDVCSRLFFVHVVLHTVGSVLAMGSDCQRSPTGRFIISEYVLNGNRSESLIRQGRRRIRR